MTKRMKITRKLTTGLPGLDPDAVGWFPLVELEEFIVHSCIHPFYLKLPVSNKTVMKAELTNECEEPP